jgi:ankyrin repeat protein
MNQKNLNEIIDIGDVNSFDYKFLKKISEKSSFDEIKTFYFENKPKINLIKFDNDDNLPIQVAIYSKDYNSTKLIIENFQNPNDINQQNDEGNSALHTSASLSNTEEITELLLLNHADVNLKNNKKQTPLHLSIGKNRVNNSKLLLNHENVKINEIDVYGFSPFLKACASQCYDVIDLLLEKKCDLNLVDNFGNSGLHYLIEDEKYDCALKVIKNGGDYLIKNKKGLNAIDLIKDVNYREIILSFIKRKENNVDF